MTTTRQRKHRPTRFKRLPVKPARALRLEAGDLLVFECAARLTKDQAESLRAYLKTLVTDGVKVLVLDPQIKLATVHTHAL